MFAFRVFRKKGKGVVPGCEGLMPAAKGEKTNPREIFSHSHAVKKSLFNAEKFVRLYAEFFIKH